MKLRTLVQYIQNLSDPFALSMIARLAVKRYQEIAQKESAENRSLATGEYVSFVLENGKKVAGVIQRRGKKNFRVLGENGRVYRVPVHLVQKEREKIPKVTLKPIFHIDKVLPLVIFESKKLLESCGLNLPIRFKKRVWSTHFRPGRHIQFGERCLAYQLTPVRATDNIGANLRRFRLPEDIPARLAMLVCHEVSHAIAHQRYGSNIPAHGRQFFTVLEELVDSEFAEMREKFTQTLDV